MRQRGEWVHGEADLVEWFGPASVLDAGCGTGRVAAELHRRGIYSVGVDIDEAMLDSARTKEPDVPWVLGDISSVSINLSIAHKAKEDGGLRQPAEPDERDPGSGVIQQFDVVVMAGNVMLFVEPGTEAAIVSNLARHLEPGGRLIAGFQLGFTLMTLGGYDGFARNAGLQLEHRWSTWEREPYRGGHYAVSVHRAPDRADAGQVR